MRTVGVNKNYQDEHNKSNDKYKLEVGLPSEVRCSAVDDIVVLLVHLQERAVLAAVLPELRIHPQTAIRHKTMQTPPPLASTIQKNPAPIRNRGSGVLNPSRRHERIAPGETPLPPNPQP